MRKISHWVVSFATILVAPAFASANTEVCDDVSCFQQTYQQAKNINIQSAPRFAWRPGHYNSSNSSSSSRSDTSRSSFGWFSSVPRQGPANPHGTVVFNPRSLTWAAYDSSGDLVKSGSASGGMGYCDDVGRPCRTPIGRYKVYAKGDENCYSRKYPLGEGGAPMPHCMYFRGGYAIHGSYHVPNYNASHGCIRVHPRAAAWLHQNFVRVGTVVVVKPY